MSFAVGESGSLGTRFANFEASWVHQGIVPRLLDVARQRPEATALVDARTSFTYASLAAAVDTLAHRIELSAPPHGPVGIILPPSAEYWISILACLAAQRPYVALDQHHPAERNADILRRSAVAAVIARRELAGSLIPADLPRIEPEISGEPRPARHTAPEALGADQPAAILYTSGSTGRPKGVANNEAALLQRVAQYVNACELRADDRFLTLSSPCTIAGTREGLTPLMIGATLQVFDTRSHSLSDVAETVRDARITVLNSVPGVLRTLIAGQPGIADALQTLRLVRVGGEVVFWSDIRLLRGALPAACRIQISYSSTESTGTQWFVPHDFAPSGPFVPVGYVLDGVIASVVDDKGRTVASGEAGELILRGPFIALGIWENGRLSEGGIDPDPADPSARVLHTGDLVSIDSDGLCTFFGRKDRQVKVNGMRVEPAETEAALRDMQEISDAAVLTVRAEKLTTLTAYVVPRQHTVVSVPHIRAGLRTRLPAPMRPSRILVIDAIPRLPSGKLDMRALEGLGRKLDAALSDDAATAKFSHAPADRVRRVWRDVLGRRSLAEGLSFEAAGGDSLKMLQLALGVESIVGRRLPLDLFHPDMQLDDVVSLVTRPIPERTATDRRDPRPMLFLLPGLDGDEPRLANFRAELDDRIHFVTIEYPDWTEMANFEAIVAVAISQIAAQATTGPLRIAGYSYGGDVAFAVASRLLEMGREVAFLGVLDTDLQRVGAAAQAFAEGHAVRDPDEILQDVARESWHTGLGFLLAKTARDVVGLERALRYRRVWRLLSGRTAFAFHRRIRTITRLQAQWRWHRNPPLPPIPARTVLFRTAAHAADAAPDLNWRTRCPNLAVVAVEGDHRTMLDPPHLAALCAKFAAEVEAAAVLTSHP